ncbi:haloacid dehalogenase-like hydrolase [Candidatus Woesearchaeota archaeon]|nr:haloacid dehalogenase-like hydrolase [Candidatus Woesearchaeota archaeon]
MAIKRFYDLDGTLSHLNSTFDFIFGYLQSRRMWLRYWLGRLAHKLAYSLGFGTNARGRSLLITLLFRGLVRDDLVCYYQESYRGLFLARLTALGTRLMKTKARGAVLLTGCTEIPAKEIGKLFGFTTVISTEFSYSKGRIAGITKDTYGDFKMRYITKEKGVRHIYYNDDFITEPKTKEMMDATVEVKNGI